MTKRRRETDLDPFTLKTILDFLKSSLEERTVKKNGVTIEIHTAPYNMPGRQKMAEIVEKYFTGKK